MAFVQDFLVIRSRDTFVDQGARETLALRFNLNGASVQHEAILNFDVQGLTAASCNPDIRINGRLVGEIDRLYMRARGCYGDVCFWMPHSLILPRGILRLGSNALEINGSCAAGNPLSGDNFRLRNIVLYYRTEIRFPLRSVA